MFPMPDTTIDLTKRDLGIGYLLGSGFGLIASIIGHILFINEPFSVTLVGSATAIILAGSLLYVGFWLRGSDLEDDHVWTVAGWSALGLSIPTALGVILTVIQITPPLPLLFPSLLINNIAAGGVAGVLFGTAIELRRENEEKTELYKRNVVLNRVLRHNIRNDMNIVLGYARQLAETEGETNGHLVTPIREKAEDVINLSESARRIESLDSAGDEGPVDAVTVVRDRISVAESSYPDATVEAELPESAWVQAGPLIGSVIDNVLENAIEHNDRDPVITVSVEGTGHDEVVIQIADNGPGIPEGEQRVLTEEIETSMRHGTGLGLWLIKWFVETYDGRLTIEENEPRGTVIEIRLPAAAPPRQHVAE